MLFQKLYSRMHQNHFSVNLYKNKGKVTVLRACGCACLLGPWENATQIENATSTPKGLPTVELQIAAAAVAAAAAAAAGAVAVET